MLKKLDISRYRSPIIIVSPHSDDEVLATAGLIHRALHLGKTVYVLFLTVGDANAGSLKQFLHLPRTPSSFIRLGYVRHAEALKVDTFMGLAKKHLFFWVFRMRNAANCKKRPDES